MPSPCSPSAATDPPYPATADTPTRAPLGVSLPERRRFCATRWSASMSFRLAAARGLHMDTSHAGSANKQLSRKGTTETRPTVTTPTAKTGPIDLRRGSHSWCETTNRLSPASWQLPRPSVSPRVRRTHRGDRGRRERPAVTTRTPRAASPTGVPTRFGSPARQHPATTRDPCRTVWLPPACASTAADSSVPAATR